MKIRLLKIKDIDKIHGLITSYKFCNYRTYRLIDKDRLAEYRMSQILELLNDNRNRVLVAENEKEVIGLVVLRLLPWDTKFFGFTMGKLDYLVSMGGYEKSITIKRYLLSSLMAVCRREKFIHLNCRVDIEDISSLHALEENGFRIMDTMVTFAFDCRKPKISYLRSIYRVRNFKKSDLPYLIDIAESSFSKDRFHLENSIPKEKANSLYGEWIRNSSHKDHILVSVNSADTPVGFFTHRLFGRLFEFTNYKIMGDNGLMAVAPSAKGAIVGLMKVVLENARPHCNYVEFYTQLSNVEVLHLFGKFNLNFIVAQYTFHKWLKDATKIEHEK